MTYTFPPTSPISLVVLWLLAVLLFAALLAPMVRIWRRRARPNRIDAVVLLGMLAIGLLVLVIARTASLEETSSETLPGGLRLMAYAVIGTAVVWGIVLVQPESVAPWLETGVWLAAVVVAANVVVMYPAVRNAREAARNSNCRGNLSQLILALHNDLDQRGTFIPAVTADGTQPPRSWRVEILPFADGADLRRQYVDSAAWDAPENIHMARFDLENRYRCPSNPSPRDAEGRWLSAYAAVTGLGTLFQTDRQLRLDEVSDGAANTLAFVEACGQNIIWTEPRDVELETLTVGINLPGKERGRSDGMLSSHHPTGVSVVFADGQVRLLNPKIDPAVLRALLTATGGESVPAGY